MKPWLALPAALVLATVAGPLQAQQHLVPAKSEITFVSRQMGVPVEGRFRRFDAQVAFDPKKPEAAKITIAIDLASVSLGTAETEAELAKPEWFGTRQFPKATFESSAVKAAGGGRFDVAGKLAIKGNTRDIVVPVTLAPAGADTAASGRFVIKRQDFRIGDGEWNDTSLVANEVQVRFKLTLSGVPAL
jgi:polyisoprenoid-binding protein YceI